MNFDRFAVCEAYYWYDTLWGPTPYGARLHKIGYRPGICQRLENADEDTKAIYGRLVREHQRLYIGYERLRRKASGRTTLRPWPGTAHMGRSAWNWLYARGLIDAVYAVTGG